MCIGRQLRERIRVFPGLILLQDYNVFASIISLQGASGQDLAMSGGKGAKGHKSLMKW